MGSYSLKPAFLLVVASTALLFAPGGASRASAQDGDGSSDSVILTPTDGSDTGDSTATYGSEPAPAPAAANDTPHGLWIGAGSNIWVHNGGIGGIRLDVGVPLMDIALGRLALTLPVVFAPDRYTGFVSGNDIKWFLIQIAPTVRWEWPVLERWGSLIVWADAGGGVMIDRFVQEGGGGIPPIEDTQYFGVIRFAGGASFTFPFGLYLTFQPFGVMGTMGNNAGEGFYENSFTVGYRFD